MSTSGTNVRPGRVRSCVVTSCLSFTLSSCSVMFRSPPFETFGSCCLHRDVTRPGLLALRDVDRQHALLARRVGGADVEIVRELQRPRKLSRIALATMERSTLRRLDLACAADRQRPAVALD